MPNKITFLSQADVKKCLNMNEAIHAMKTAFSELSLGNVKSPLRTNISINEGESGALFMPVYYPEKKYVGLKSVMINKNNPHLNLPMIQAMYSVFDAETGQPIVIMDGEYLTAMRTGAASGLASDLLAPSDSKIAVVFGAGTQAEKQIEAVSEVKSLNKIYISDLNKERIRKLIELLQPNVNAELKELDSREHISHADIICTATSSSVPVFDHAELKSKVHINGIGSYRPDMREVPAETIINSKLYADSKEACLNEAGDIIKPILDGQITEAHIYSEIGEVLIGTKKARESNDNITLFKSVGNAVQDIAAASVIIENAEKLKLGVKINL